MKIEPPPGLPKVLVTAWDLEPREADMPASALRLRSSMRSCDVLSGASVRWCLSEYLAPDLTGRGSRKTEATEGHEGDAAVKKSGGGPNLRRRLRTELSALVTAVLCGSRVHLVATWLDGSPKPAWMFVDKVPYRTTLTALSAAIKKSDTPNSLLSAIANGD